MKLKRACPERRQLPKTIEAAVITQGQEPAPYDAHADPVFENWDDWKERLDQIKRSGAMGQFVPTAIKLAFLFPEQRTDIGINDDLFDRMLAEMKEYTIEGGWRSILQATANIISLFPERRSELSFSDAEFISMLQELDRHRNADRDARRFMEVARNLCLVFPNRRAEIGLTEDDFQWQVEEMLLPWAKPNKTELFFGVAFDLRIMFPDKTTEEVGVDEVKIQEMLAFMKDNETDDEGPLERLKYLSGAYYLTVVTAPKVRITNAGIELDKGRGLDQASQLPQRNLT